MNRRDFLKLQAAAGLAACMPTGLQYLSSNGYFPPKAKSVVLLFMTGGPSQMDLFDYKPELIKYDKKSLSLMHADGYSGSEMRITDLDYAIMAPISKFKKYGECGQWVSDLLPNMSKLVDDVTMVNSLTISNADHTQAQLEYHTGAIFPGQPYIGAWLEYALKQKQGLLPKSFIMTDVLGRTRLGDLAWNSANLPNSSSKFVCAGVDEAYQILSRISGGEKEAMAKFIKQFESAEHLPAFAENSFRNQKRVDHFKLIYSMRDSLLKILDTKSITSEESKLYGVENPASVHLAKQLLVARRLVEHEVPFIEVYCGGDYNEVMNWDHHIKIHDLKIMTELSDRPVYGFITDLKNRGLLDSTIVVWGGEMGRRPVVDKHKIRGYGRPHNGDAGTLMLMGAGIKKGFSFGETDELSLHTVKDPVTMGDIWATVFHLMGIDHRKIYFNDESNKEMRVTRSSSRVLHEILC